MKDEMITTKKDRSSGKVFRGVVVKGDGMASRDFDLPTANLSFTPLPRMRYGIYAARVFLADRPVQSVVSWGPAAEGKKFEVHLFDFEGDLLGKTLEVHVLQRVGEWIPWTSKERMRQKIWSDVAAVHEWFAREDGKRK